MLPMSQFLRGCGAARGRPCHGGGLPGIGSWATAISSNLSWLDSLLNASMILSSMGPVTPLKTDGGKWFASFYALFSGVAFITVISIVAAPIAHRLLHQFHLERDGRGEPDAEPQPGARRK